MGLSATPLLTISDSGVRVSTPGDHRDELFALFTGNGITCVIEQDGHGAEKIVFHSPYQLDRIMTLFQRWQNQRTRR